MYYNRVILYIGETRFFCLRGKGGVKMRKGLLSLVVGLIACFITVSLYADCESNLEFSTDKRKVHRVRIRNMCDEYPPYIGPVGISRFVEEVGPVGNPVFLVEITNIEYSSEYEYSGWADLAPVVGFDRNEYDSDGNLIRHREIRDITYSSYCRAPNRLQAVYALEPIGSTSNVAPIALGIFDKTYDYDMYGGYKVTVTIANLATGEVLDTVEFRSDSCQYAQALETINNKLSNISSSIDGVSNQVDEVSNQIDENHRTEMALLMKIYKYVCNIWRKVRSRLV